MAEFNYPSIAFQTTPDQYTHWKVEYRGNIAEVIMNVQIDSPMWQGRYELKSSSYDLAVDIELNDIVQRMRFEHPEVKVVLVSSANDKVLSDLGMSIDWTNCQLARYTFAPMVWGTDWFSFELNAACGKCSYVNEITFRDC